MSVRGRRPRASWASGAKSNERERSSGTGRGSSTRAQARARARAKARAGGARHGIGCRNGRPTRASSACYTESLTGPELRRQGRERAWPGRRARLAASRAWLAGSSARLAASRAWLAGSSARLAASRAWLAGSSAWLAASRAWLTGSSAWLAASRAWLAGSSASLARSRASLAGSPRGNGYGRTSLADAVTQLARARASLVDPSAERVDERAACADSLAGRADDRPRQARRLTALAQGRAASGSIPGTRARREARAGAGRLRIPPFDRRRRWLPCASSVERAGEDRSSLDRHRERFLEEPTSEPAPLLPRGDRHHVHEPMGLSARHLRLNLVVYLHERE